jgi:hypothetical protein
MQLFQQIFLLKIYLIILVALAASLIHLEINGRFWTVQSIAFRPNSSGFIFTVDEYKKKSANACGLWQGSSSKSNELTSWVHLMMKMSDPQNLPPKSTMAALLTRMVSLTKLRSILSTCFENCLQSSKVSCFLP